MNILPRFGETVTYRNGVAVLTISAPTGEHITGCPRPPWYRPFARRRWDRSVELGKRLYHETASRMGVLVGPEQ